MPSPLVVLALLAALGVACIVALQTVLHRDAARDDAARLAACPFDDGDDATTLGMRIRSIVVESVTTLVLVVLRPLGALAGAKRSRRSDAPAAGDRPPVVLVHGAGGTPVSLVLLARRLRRDGWTRVHLIRPGAEWRDLEHAADRVGAAIAGVGPGPIDVVAHGLAGLAVRAWLRDASATRSVRRLVTLGTAHRGTAACPWLRTGLLRADARPDSPALRALAAREQRRMAFELIAIASPDGPLRFPATNASHPGAFNVSVRGVGHLELLLGRRSYELVCENLLGDASAQDVRGTHAG